MIFVIDDDEIMAGCVAKAVGRVYEGEIKIFGNGIEAIAAMDEEVPELIFLDVLLDGPDGFTLLNEMGSYADLERVPVVMISSLGKMGLAGSGHNVVGELDKSEMTPEMIQEFVKNYAGK